MPGLSQSMHFCVASSIRPAYRQVPNSNNNWNRDKSIYPDPNPFQTPRIYIYIPASDSGLFPATAEFLRITQDPNTESVARVSRARVRAGIRVSRFSPAAGELTSRS